MAYEDRFQYGYEPGYGEGGRIYDAWQTIYDEYDSPDWFEDQIWGPFSDKLVGAHVRMDFRDPNRMMDSEWGNWFSAFDTRDWDRLDESYALEASHLKQETDLMTEQHEKLDELDERIFGEKRDSRIERADMEFKKKMGEEERRKEKIRLDAIATLSNIDNIIGQSGLSSGGVGQKRDIELQSVQAELNQANMNRKLAAPGRDKEHARAIDDYESSITSSNLKRDVQYESKFLNTEQKKKAAGMQLMTDKLNVYDEWKADQVGQIKKMFQYEATFYDPEDLREAWSVGGDEYELMKGMYDEFTGNFDQWKEENAELWADMKANPENYVNTTARTWQSGEMGYDLGYDPVGGGVGGLMYGPFGMLAGGLLGGTDREWTTPQGWANVNLSEEQIEQALINQIFISGSGNWQGTQFKEEWGEWSPWMVMKDVAVASGDYNVTDAGTWSDVDEFGNPQFLNIYDFGDFMTNPYEEAISSGEWDFMTDVTEDQFTSEDKEWYDYLNIWTYPFKDYFYS